MLAVECERLWLETVDNTRNWAVTDENGPYGLDIGDYVSKCEVAGDYSWERAH